VSSRAIIVELERSRQGDWQAVSLKFSKDEVALYMHGIEEDSSRLEHAPSTQYRDSRSACPISLSPAWSSSMNNGCVRASIYNPSLAIL
jgi:hypothetical protein